MIRSLPRRACPLVPLLPLLLLLFLLLFALHCSSSRARTPLQHCCAFCPSALGKHSQHYQRLGAWAGSSVATAAVAPFTMGRFASGHLLSRAASASYSRRLLPLPSLLQQQQNPHHIEGHRGAVTQVLTNARAPPPLLLYALGWQGARLLRTSRSSSSSSSSRGMGGLRCASGGPRSRPCTAARGSADAEAAAAAAAAAHSLLCQKIKELNNAYFLGDGEAPVTDEAYDALWRELQSLEKKHPHLRRPDSPLQLVGASPERPRAAATAATASSSSSCQHLAPVLSLESVHSSAEALQLFRRIDRLVRKASKEGRAPGVGRRRRRKTQTETSGVAEEAADTPTAAAAAAARGVDEGGIVATATESESDVATAAAATQRGDEEDDFALPLFLEPKVDGQSVSLTYALLNNSSSSNNNNNSNNSSSNSGVRYRLVRALTRGDGRWGEDITPKALLLGEAGILPLEITNGGNTPAAAAAAAGGGGGEQADPIAFAAAAASAAVSAAASPAGTQQCWPRQLEVRGEAFVSLPSFRSLNARRASRGLKPFSSPRHAVVGLLRRLEGPTEEQTTSISFCAYGLVASSPSSVGAAFDQDNPEEALSIPGGSDAAAAAAASGAAVAGVTTQQDLLQRLEEWGFQVLLPHSRLVRRRREALAAFEEQSRAHGVYASRLDEILQAPAAPGASAAATAKEATGAAASPLALESLPCDGVVYKLNSLQQQQRLGITARHPRWAFALKFVTTATRTRVVGVEWTVGSSGVCTPVALLQPVLLGGVTLGRASLHSLQEMRRKDVRVGDQVYVHLKGESVPQISGIDLNARRVGTPPVSPPTQCPSCGRALMERPLPAEKQAEGSSTGPPRRRQQRPKHTSSSGTSAAGAATAAGAAQQGPAAPKGGVLWCPGGWSCGAQRLQRLRRFFSREGVAVAGLGPRALEALTSRGYLEAPSDAFFLKEADRRRVAAGEKGIEDWPGWGPQARDALFKETRQVQQRGVSLPHLLFALGIPGMGRRAAAALAQRAQTFEGFLKLLDDLATCPHGVQNGRAGAADGEASDPRQHDVKLPGVDSALLQELRLFGADPRNRHQLLALAKALPIQPVT